MSYYLEKRGTFIMITINEFNELIAFFNGNKGSDSSVFLSSAKTDEAIGAHLAALANGDGGDVFVGLDFTNYHLLGCDLDEAFFDALIRTHCSSGFCISLNSILRNDKVILQIHVFEAAKKPVSFMGQVFVRHLGRTRVAQEDELRHLAPSPESVSPVNGILILTGEAEASSVPIDVAKELIIESIPVPEKSPIPEKSVSKPVETQSSKAVEGKPIVSAESIMEQSIVNVPGSSLNEISVPALAPVETPAPVVKVTQASEEVAPHFPKGFQISKVLNKRQKRAINYLKKRPFIKNKRYRSMFDISHKTAHLELSEMVSMGILRIEGSGRSTSYALDHLPEEMNKTPQPVQAKTEVVVDHLVENELQEIKSMVDQINDSPSTPLGFIERKTILKDYLQTHTVIQVNDYAALANISSVIAEKDLNDLVFSEELIQSNDGYSLKIASISTVSL